MPVGVLVEYEGMDGSPAHIPTTEGELSLASGELLGLFDSLFSKPSLPSSHVCLSSSLASSSPYLLSSVSHLVLSGAESPVSSLVPSSPKFSVTLLVPSRRDLLPTTSPQRRKDWVKG